MDEEFLLEDRLQKIRQIVSKYGEENFYLSFSGGKDSTVLSALVDMALPGNTIPRVFADTGIEYNMIRDFVYRMAEQKKPWEMVILKPSVPIKETLEKVGYPFKSKTHSQRVYEYQKYGMHEYLERYVDNNGKYGCPKILRYQFDPEWNKLKISDKCCKKMKTEPMKHWAEENKKYHAIIGVMPDEGGRRVTANCIAWKTKKRFNFQPLVAVTKKWEDWFIEKYKIEICDIYKEPYNFNRTGCKGCPFAIGVQQELDVLEKYFPNERKQCESIWAPVYAEYRRLGYRLKE